MDIRMQLDPSRRHLILGFLGELDLATAGEIGEALDAFDAAQFDRVILDLSGIAFCDCAGLGALVAAHRAITDAGALFSLSRPSHPVRRLLATVGCDWLLTPITDQQRQPVRVV